MPVYGNNTIKSPVYLEENILFASFIPYVVGTNAIGLNLYSYI